MMDCGPACYPDKFLELGISRRVLDSLGETAASVDLTDPLLTYEFIRQLVGIGRDPHYCRKHTGFGRTEPAI